jgi:hypothetical protein
MGLFDLRRDVKGIAGGDTGMAGNDILVSLGGINRSPRRSILL